MSFQITVLKVLAGQREGRLSLAELRHDVAILISSGRDWTDRTKRLAARASAAGRALLTSIEAPTSTVQGPAETADAVSLPPSTETSVPLIGVYQRRSRRRRRSGRNLAPRAA